MTSDGWKFHGTSWSTCWSLNPTSFITIVFIFAFFSLKSIIVQSSNPLLSIFSPLSISLISPTAPGCAECTKKNVGSARRVSSKGVITKKREARHIKGIKVRGEKGKITFAMQIALAKATLTYIKVFQLSFSPIHLLKYNNKS